MSESSHPKDTYTLEKVEAQAAAFEDAIARGRLHHAWLLTGPEGVGKASFAYRAARRLLGAKMDDRFGPMGAAPDDPVSRLIASQSHPDLLVLERSGEGARKVIPVDEARRLPTFFSKAPAMGPYRVAIIDAVDDFNANGANAVLKTLEEPSARGVLLLISHAPGRLLPTIRSRCRTLRFRPWEDAAVQLLAQAAAGLTPEVAVRVSMMAQGSPGRAIGLRRSNLDDLDAVTTMMLDASPGSSAALMTVAESFRGGEGGSRFSLLVERLMRAVLERARTGDKTATRWAELWTRLADVPGRVEGLNLDRADAFWSIVTDVAAASRNPC